MLAEKFKSAKGSSVEEIAKAAGAEVLEASSLTLATPIIPGAGRAPKTVGVAFGLAENMVSAPVADETGVFVASISARRDAKPIENYESVQNMLTEAYMSTLQSLLPSLRDKADIEDHRAKIEKMYGN